MKKTKLKKCIEIVAAVTVFGLLCAMTVYAVQNGLI